MTNPYPGTKPPPFIDLRTYQRQVYAEKQRPCITPKPASAISIEPAGGWMNRARIRGGAR